MNIEIKIGNAKFSNPVTVASGTFGHSEEYFDLDEVRKLGALIPKTVTLFAQEGNPPPRIAETPSGMLNAIGIENPGVDVFIKEKLSVYQKIGVPLIISVSGHDEKTFLTLVEKLDHAQGIAALELNLSCPNLKNKNLVSQDEEATRELIRQVKGITETPLIAKLTPNVTDITKIALAAEEGGADGVSLVNTFTAMAIDTKTRKSVLGNFTGGLSGPAIRPIALNMVYRVAKKVKIPIIAMGGIVTADHALQYLIAGATMVAVGTANFINPRAPLEVLNGIKEYLQKNKIRNIREIIGSIKE